jgi:hypothetical protein
VVIERAEENAHKAVENDSAFKPACPKKYRRQDEYVQEDARDKIADRNTPGLFGDNADRNEHQERADAHDSGMATEA